MNLHITNRAPNWPENAPYGSHALHLHYLELVDIWNHYARMNRTGAMTRVTTSPSNNECEGHTVLAFEGDSLKQSEHSLLQFTEMFKLGTAVIDKGTLINTHFVEMNNIFPRDKVEAFLRVLDIQRCELLATHNEWETYRPSLGAVFTHSSQLFMRFKHAHDAITEARCAMMKKEECE